MMSEASLVTITPKAASKAREFLANEQKQNAGLRVYVAGGGCSGMSYGMVLEEAAGEDDLVIKEDGLSIFIDPTSAQYLKGSQIDYAESLMGSGFKIENPNVVSSCACGQSFTTS